MTTEEILRAAGRKQAKLMSRQPQHESTEFQDFKRSQKKGKRGRTSMYQAMLEAEDDDEQANEEEY